MPTASHSLASAVCPTGPAIRSTCPVTHSPFFVYKQIAADNASIVTEAFLSNWDGA